MGWDWGTKAGTCMGQSTRLLSSIYEAFICFHDIPYHTHCLTETERQQKLLWPVRYGSEGPGVQHSGR